MNDGTWYRIGTVSLTNGSDLVNGVGTAFIDNVFVGGIFFSPIGLHEVTRVISDTQLQLVAAYAGATVAAAPFAVAPTQGAVVAATKQLQTFLTTLGPLKQAWEAGDLNAKGLVLKGVKPTEVELPTSGNVQGDGWLVDGTLFVWTGTLWSDQGKLTITPELEALRDETLSAKESTQAIAAELAGVLGVATAQADRSEDEADRSGTARVGAEAALSGAVSAGDSVGSFLTLAAAQAKLVAGQIPVDKAVYVTADGALNNGMWVNRAGTLVRESSSTLQSQQAAFDPAGPLPAGGMLGLVSLLGDGVLMGLRPDGFSFYIRGVTEYTDQLPAILPSMVDVPAMTPVFRGTDGPLPASGVVFPVLGTGGQTVLGVRMDGSMYWGAADDQMKLLPQVPALVAAVPALSTSVSALNAQVQPIAKIVDVGPLPVNGLVWHVSDRDGYVKEGTYVDGRQYYGLNAPVAVAVPPLAYTKTASGKQQVFVSDGAGETQVTASAFDKIGPTAIATPAGVGVRYAAARNGSMREWCCDTAGNRDVPAGGQIAHTIMIGQSLAQGALGTPPSHLIPTYPATALMFNGGLRTGLPGGSLTAVVDPSALTAFVPLVESTTGAFGETPASGFVNLIQSEAAAYLGVNPLQLVSNAAVSGQAYAPQKKGTVPYANAIAQVTAGKAVAAARGWQYWVPYLLCVHGEANHFQSTPRATYLANQIEWRSDYSADVLAITGQTDPVDLLISQLSSWTAAAARPTAACDVVLAQLDAAEQDAHIHLVCPKYFFSYAPDGVHLADATNYAKLGEYHAKAHRVVSGGRKWRPLSPRTITRVGAVIDVQFWVPAGVLALDTVRVSDPGNYGFRYADDSSGAAISSVALLAGATDTVRITLSADPGAAMNKLVGYADRGVSGNSGGPTTGPRGCLRDTDTTLSLIDGLPLYDWAVHFTKNLA